MFNCQKMTFLMSKQKEEALCWTQKMQIALHQMMCPHCRAFDKNNQVLEDISKKMFE
ncbi:MAG: hypothetical protein Q4B71_05885 [Cardiobacteriaceae bacterium]|nr:hypothetical protein [Cardiobacteriaceae bacterium]